MPDSLWHWLVVAAIYIILTVAAVKAARSKGFQADTAAFASLIVTPIVALIVYGCLGPAVLPRVDASTPIAPPVPVDPAPAVPAPVAPAPSGPTSTWAWWMAFLPPLFLVGVLIAATNGVRMDLYPLGTCADFASAYVLVAVLDTRANRQFVGDSGLTWGLTLLSPAVYLFARDRAFRQGQAPFIVWLLLVAIFNVLPALMLAR